MSTLPKLGKSDEYNSRSQQSRRQELVNLSSSPNEDDDAPSSFLTTLSPSQFESPSAGQSTGDLISSLEGRGASKPGMNSKPPERSKVHNEAYEALAAREAQGATSAHAAAVAQLLDETIGQYQTMINSNTTASAVPTAATSAPSPPTAAKKLFTPQTFNPSTHPNAAAAASINYQPPPPFTLAMADQQGIPREGMKPIRVLHQSVQQTLGAIQNKTSKILQEQERDLLRSFKLRLLEVSDELEKERKKNESGSIEWVARCRKLTEELDWVRELTESLSTENKSLLKENRKMSRIASTQEQDRQFLITQLVSVKKENARLRFMLEQQMNQNQTLLQQSQQQQQQQQHLLTTGSGINPLQLTTGSSTGQFALLHSASSTTSSFPSPPFSAHSSSSSPTNALSRRFNSIGMNNTIHDSKSQQQHSQPNSAVPSTAPNRMLSSAGSSSNPFPPPPPNMRASILAAATTEFPGATSTGAANAFSPLLSARPSTTTGEYMPPTSAGGSQSARGARGSGGSLGGGRGMGAPSPLGANSALLPESKLAPGAEKRFKTVIAKLKRQLESEGSKYRSMRAAYMAEIQSRTQLQHVFKGCVDAVKEKQQQQQQQQQQGGTQAKQKSTKPSHIHASAQAQSLIPSSSLISSGLYQSNNAPPFDPRLIPPPDLTVTDRVQLMEWFFSQPAVFMFVFDRMFPVELQGASFGWAQGLNSNTALTDLSSPYRDIDQQFMEMHGLQSTSMNQTQQGSNAVPILFDPHVYLGPDKSSSGGGDANRKQQQFALDDEDDGSDFESPRHNKQHQKQTARTVDEFKE